MMRLSDDQLCQFREDGFLVIRNFFALEQLQPVIEWIDSLVDELAERLYAAGRIRDKHAEEGFATRLTKLEQEFPGAAVLIHIGGVLGQPLADLWGAKELLDVVEQILGPEIAGHPVWNLRTKTPLNPLATVPWHQDTAYLASRRAHPPAHRLDSLYRCQCRQRHAASAPRRSPQRQGFPASARADHRA